MTLLFGYRHVSGVPRCPCADPGNYMSLKRVDGLVCQFQCWCGRTMRCDFDSEEELTEFVAAQTGNNN